MTREKAIEILKSECYVFNPLNFDRTTLINTALDMATEALEQKPKTGHWIMTNEYYTGAYGSIDYVKCSCCHEDSLEEGNYCPNCGAKMESEG